MNFTPQNTLQQIGLAHIPAVGESIRFFAPILAEDGQTVLVSFAGAGCRFLTVLLTINTFAAEGEFYRNTGRTPWNSNADFHFAQDFHFGKNAKAPVSIP